MVASTPAAVPQKMPRGYGTSARTTKSGTRQTQAIGANPSGDANDGSARA